MASTKREKELARQRAERQAARGRRRRAAPPAAQRGARQRRRRRARRRCRRRRQQPARRRLGRAVGRRRGRGRDRRRRRSDPSAAAVPSARRPPLRRTRRDAGRAAGDPGCSYEKTAEPAAREVLLPPTEGVETTNVYAVTIATDRGDIVFEMDSATTPCTANNLRSLAHFRYFDDTACHRLTTKGIERPAVR